MIIDCISVDKIHTDTHKKHTHSWLFSLQLNFTWSVSLQLRVNDRQVDLLEDALESLNVVDCGERRLCERGPCSNGGTCEDLPGPNYKYDTEHSNCEIIILVFPC